MDSPADTIISIPSSVNSDESDEYSNSTVTNSPLSETDIALLYTDEEALQTAHSLWDEVTNILDRNERVDPTKAMLALRDAIRHSSYSPITKEARSFIDANMSRIVSVLVEYLEVGDVDSSENSRFKTTLRMTLEYVAVDLKEASMFKTKCRTLSSFTIIFDEVTGFQGGNSEELIPFFWFKRGFEHLGSYLSSITTSDFPRLDEISTILTVAHQTLSRAKKCFSDKDAKRAYQEKHDGFFAGIMMICRGVMNHLVSISEDALLKLEDDSIDICDQVGAIHAAMEYHYPRAMSDFSNLYRMFVFRLIDSSALSLKLLGWKEVVAIVKISLHCRPPPQAYLVQGAVAVVNGQYTLHQDGIDIDGYVVKELSRIRYFKDSDDTFVLFQRMAEGYSTPHSKWHIADCGYDNDSFEINYYYSKAKEYNGDMIAPRSEWLRCYPRGSDPTPTVIPLGLVAPEGSKFSTLEHESVAWIFQSNLLTLVTQETPVMQVVPSEVEAAKSAMLNAIEQVLDLILQTFQWESESEITCNEESDNDHKTEAASFTELIMKHILLLSNAVLENIGKDFINKTCEQLKEICERISTPKHRHIVDYHIFRCLLDLKLKSASCTSIVELEQLFCLDLENSPAKALMVDGAGSDVVNGHYDLNVGDYVTYTKRDPTVDDGTTLTIHQCLYGPDSGCWVISQHDQGQPYSDMTSDYYINRSGRKNVPPKIGWTECGSGVFPPPELIPIGSLHVMSGIETEQIHDDSDSARNALLNQHQFWGALQQHSAMAGMPASMTTDRMKQALSQSLSSLSTSETNEIHNAFARCAREIIGNVYDLDWKRQSLITEFFKVRKRKEPNQGARFNSETKKIKRCSPLKDQDAISVVPMDIS